MHHSRPRVSVPDGRRTGQTTVGLIEWFRPGEEDKVEHVLADLRTLSLDDLRFGFSWADYFAPGGEKWYDWLLPRLAKEVRILPCFHYTPPSLGITYASASPPREPKAYADFLDAMITRHGYHFEWVELWNEPNNLSDWDWRLDPEWHVFCEMIGGAAYWARQRGKKTVLGGLCPTDPNWLRLVGDRGVLAQFDAIGIHGFPGTWEFDWEDWSGTVDQVRKAIAPYAPQAEIWVTEAGFSTWKHDERGQLLSFLRACEAPVSRMYWYSAYDLDPDLPTQDGFHADERHYHMGLKRPDGSPKLLARLWEDGGLDALPRVSRMASADLAGSGHVLITGGAGFVGSNLAERLLAAGRSVLVFDLLACRGSEENVREMRNKYGSRIRLEAADMRDRPAIRRALQGAESVFHLAARRPDEDREDSVLDFEVNARGTLNLLEELRRLDNPPPLVFTSTSDVYGPMSKNADIHMCGHSESHPLDPHGSGASSKAAAEHYVIDCARRFGLSAVVLRLGMIYGARRGWDHDLAGINQAILCAIEDDTVKVHWDGKGARDLLHIDDLVEALLVTERRIGRLSVTVFNVGGGPENCISPMELIESLTRRPGVQPSIRREDRSPSAPLWNVLDTSRFVLETGWTPTIRLSEGLASCYRRAVDSREPRSVALVAAMGEGV